MSKFNNEYYEQAMQRALSAPVPARTETYSPVPHEVFVNTLRRKIEERGHMISNHSIHVDEKGNKISGYYSIKNTPQTENQLGMEMSAGYKNSYDKSMVAGFAMGGRVIVCSNGVVAGDLVAFKRKHTGTILEELERSMELALIKMETGFQKLISECELMKNYNLTQRQKAGILGILYFDEEIVSTYQVAEIKRQMEESEFFRGDSLWDLYNNITESLKSSHPIRHIQDHIRLHDFMLGVAGSRKPEIILMPVEPGKTESNQVTLEHVSETGSVELSEADVTQTTEADISTVL